MNEKKLSKLQKEYRTFFLEKLRLYEVNSPAKLSKEEKSKFFTDIKTGWAINKLLKKQNFEIYEITTIVKQPRETYRNENTQGTGLKKN